MAIVLEATSAGSPPTRMPIEAGRNSFRARPGTRYQIIDDTGARIDQNVAIRRVGNDLLIDGLPDSRLVELDGFFTRCTPDNSCALSMQNLGGTGPAAEVTPATEPVAALKDGSFLMYTTQSVAAILPAAPEAAEAGSWFKPVGYTLAALAVAGAAGGGGGGGGGGGSAPVDTTPPAAPTVSSGATTKSARPVISGTTEANATVTVFIDVDGNGSFPVRYQVKADGAGNWSVDTATVATAAGTMHDLASGTPVTVRVVATDTANNLGPATSFVLTVDNVAPAQPTISAVAGDNIVNGAEKTAGVTLDGTAEAGSTVSVTWGAVTHQVTASAAGTWQSVFAPNEVPADNPTTTVAVVATDAAGNASSAATRSVVVDSLSTVIISPISADGIVNAAERAAGVAVTGTAKPNSTVTVSWSGSAGAAHTTTADGSGNWTTTFASADIPAIPSATVTAIATDPLGNIGNNSRTVTTDLVAPSAPVITDNVAAATASGPVTFTLTFNEPVIGLTGADVTVVGGTAGALTQVGTSSVYTLAVTPTAGVQAGTITVTLPAGTFTDAAGNPNASAASASHNYDTAAPALTITDNVAAATANAPTTFTFAFSEAPTGFTVGDIQVAGGTAGALTTVDATHYSLVVTPNAATSAGTMTVTVAAASFSDALGNTNANPIVATQDYDTLAPAAPTITDNVAAATATGATIFTFAFGEAPLQSSLALGDFTVSGGVASALTQIDATHYSILVTPAANSVGTMSVSLGAGTFTDLAGNANPAASATATQAFDTNVPTVTITDGTGAAVTNAPTTFNFALSEAPAAGTFTAADVNVTGGTAGALTTIDATHYSMVVTPTAATAAGTMSVSIAAGAFTNGTGTGNLAAGPANQDYDTLAPSVAPTITDNVAALNATGATTFTFAFAEAPLQSSLALGDFTVGGGTASALTQIDATHYSVLVTPPSNATGTLSISLGAGTFTDAAGNANTTGSATATQDFDTNVPTVAITDGTAAATTNSATTFNFALSEAPGSNGFAIGDISVSGGTAGTFTVIDATHYSLVVTPTAATASGTMSVSVGAGAFNNAAGTGNTAAGPATQAYDTLAPTETASSFTVTDNVAPTTGLVADNGTTDDSTPAIVLTLSAVLGAGETLTLARSTDGAPSATVGTATAGAGSLSLTDSVTVGSAHTYVYAAAITDAAGNSTLLDLNGAGAGNSFTLHTI